MHNEILNNPAIPTTPSAEMGSAYQTFVMTATVGNDGTMNIMVVNRDPDSAVTSVNSPENPDAVGIEASTANVGDSDFRYTFPTHSVTLIRLAPR